MRLFCSACRRTVNADQVAPGQSAWTVESVLFSKTSRKAKFLAVAALTVVSALASSAPVSARTGVAPASSTVATYKWAPPVIGQKIKIYFDACTKQGSTTFFDRYSYTACPQAIVESINIQYVILENGSKTIKFDKVGKIYSFNGSWTSSWVVPANICKNYLMVVDVRYSRLGVIHKAYDAQGGYFSKGVTCP